MGKVVKKIGGGLLGGLFGKKKKAAAAAPTGPVITPLGQAADSYGGFRRRKANAAVRSALGANITPTILSDKLGS